MGTRKDAPVKQYRLMQVADYVCGIELEALKYDRHAEASTNLLFFGKKSSFTKNWLKKARKNLLA